MATSLAKQLQALSAPQTSRLTKEHAVSSLLFEPKDASALERDDIYTLAQNGLDGLDRITDVFHKFRSSIFSEQSKFFERSVKDLETNKALNKEIELFLKLLSPYIQIKPAHKTLEWLIRRFQIHLYNCDALMKCVLPLHESKIFVRVVQILDFKLSDSSSWRFLAPLQKSGTTLSKQTLFNVCCSDMGLLHTVCQIANEAVMCKELTESSRRTAVSFYMSTILGVLKQSKNISEDLLTIITPHLVFGLKSSSKDYISASYFILVYITQKVYLENAWFERIFISLLENVHDGLEKEALNCFSICFMFQELEHLSPKCCKLLLKSHLRSAIADMATSKALTRLFRCLTEGAVTLAMKKSSKRIERIKWLLQCINFSDEDILSILSSAVNIHLKRKSTSSQECLKIISGIVQKKYSTVFDKYLEEFSSEATCEDLDSLCEVIGTSRLKADDFSVNSNDDLVLYLNHPSATFRKRAVQMLETSKVTVGNLESILLARLKDDDPGVVQQVLSSSELSAVKSENLKKSLFELSCTFYESYQWANVAELALNKLNEMSFSSNDEYLLVQFLPLLFPFDEIRFRQLRDVLSKLKMTDNSTSFALWDVCKALSIVMTMDFKFAESMAKQITVFSKTVLKYDDVKITHFLKELTQNQEFNAPDNFNSHILPLLVKDLMVKDISSAERLQFVLNYFSRRFSDVANVTARKTKFDFANVLEANSYTEFFTAIEKYLSHDKRNTLAYLMSATIYAVKCISTQCYQHPESMEEILIMLIRGIVKAKEKPMKNVFQLLLNYVIKSALNDRPKLLSILINLLRRSDTSPAIAIHCLCLLKGVAMSETCHKHFDSLLFLLLPYCNSEHELIRESALDCLTVIKGNYIDTINFILQYRDEIQNDYKYLTRSLKEYSQLNDCKFAITVLDLILKEETTDFVKYGLLVCLDKVHSPFVIDQMLQILKDILTITSPLTTYQHYIIQKVLSHINSTSLTSYPKLDLMMELLSKALLHTAKQLDGLPTIQELTLQYIKKAIYLALPSADLKRSIIKELLELRNDKNNKVGLLVSRILRKVLVDGAEIVYHLEGLLKDDAAPSTLLRELAIKQTKDNRYECLLILEAMEGNSDLTERDLIIPVVFKFLKQSLDAKEQSDYELELVASCLLNICADLTECGEQSYFNIDLLIKCLQRKSTPRFHGTILQILSAIASHFPELVLRDAVNLFALMSGSSLLQQDDSYSFGIILATLDNVLPSIFTVLKTSMDSDEIKSVSSWIRIFVDALPDILAHRRIPLLKTLITALGSGGEWLWLLLATIVELYVTWDTRKGGYEERKATINFAIEFCCQFPPSEQLYSAIKLCDELSRILKDKMLHWMYLKTDRHKQNFCRATVAFISSLFANNSFLKQLIGSDEDLSIIYPELTRAVFNLLNTVQQLNKKDDNPRESLVKGCFQLIEKTVAVVPAKMFIDIVIELLKSDDIRLQCKVVDFLPKKLQYEIGELEFEDLEDVYYHLLEIIKSQLKEKLTDLNRVMLQQLSLLCCKYLAKHYAKTHKEAFQNLAKVSIEVLKKASNNNVISNALLCVAELCISLEAHFIIYLNHLIPVFMELFNDQSRIKKDELLLSSLVTLLSKLVECQQSFLSPYLDKILLHVCRLCTVYSVGAKNQLSNHLGLICRNLSRKVELRILFPAVKSSFERLVENNPRDVIPLMHIVTEGLRVASDAVGLWNEFLSQFFFKALDYRSKHKNDADTIAVVEEGLFEPVSVLVLKMSEVNFRPFFMEFFSWATKREGINERIFTFYSLTDRIADKLKNLFVLFAGQIISHMVSLLETNNSSSSADPTIADEAMNDKLLNYIFDILYKCFVNDTQGFINTERFLTLVTPLVNQLDNEAGDYSKRLKHLIPCLSHLPLAVTPDVSLQPFVNQILFKTRHSLSKVKCAALECIRQIAKRMNEDFMSLLPETVPYLAELMEDDESDVVQLCQSVVVDLEGIMGEPLQKYFNNPKIL